jgi:hypothetical protein
MFDDPSSGVAGNKSGLIFFILDCFRFNIVIGKSLSYMIADTPSVSFILLWLFDISFKNRNICDACERE